MLRTTATTSAGASGAMMTQWPVCVCACMRVFVRACVRACECTQAVGCGCGWCGRARVVWKSRSQEGKTTHLCLRERDRLRQREGGGFAERERQKERVCGRERERERTRKKYRDGRARKRGSEID